jgi:hypothetical protein
MGLQPAEITEREEERALTAIKWRPASVMAMVGMLGTENVCTRMRIIQFLPSGLQTGRPWGSI